MTGTSTATLYALTAAQTVGKFDTDVLSGIGAARSARYAASAYGTNAALAKAQAADAIARGEEAAAKMQGRVRRTIGSQRAALAASGVDVNVGSALDLALEAQTVGAQDEMVIRNNARREAFGYDVQASDYLSRRSLALLQGRNDVAASALAGGNTLLGGASRIYDIYRTGK